MNSAIGPKLPLSTSKGDGIINIKSFSEEARQNFKILLLTNPGERVFDKNFGVGLRNYLFENAEAEDLESTISQRIEAQVGKYTPSIRILSLDIESDENLLYVRIKFYTANGILDEFIFPFSQ